MIEGPGNPRPAKGPPARENMEGRVVRLEPVDPGRHVGDLFAVSRDDPEIWTYLPYGPFADEAEMLAWLKSCAASDDPLFFALVEMDTAQAAGMASLMSTRPSHGVIEIGHIWFSSLIRGRRAASEAIFLMLRQAFDRLGYRRVEWKCNAANAASRAAARRFGFAYEGTFPQHMIVKGRNRDTAWFSILDQEWPPIRAAFETWLAPGNFDAEGKQRQRLSELVAAARPARQQN